MAAQNRQTVQVDTASKTGKNLGAVTSTTHSVTVASNPNRCLVLIFCSRGGGVISSATFAGGSFVLGKRSSGYDGCFTEIWYLKNPAVTTANIAVNFSSATSDRSLLGVISLYNVDRIDPVDITGEKVANAGSFTSSFTPTQNNCVVVEGQFNTGTTSGSVAGGQTLIFNRSSNDSGGCSYETDIDATSESVGWSGFETGSTAYSHAFVVFQGARYPSGGAGLMID